MGVAVIARSIRSRIKNSMELEAALEVSKIYLASIPVLSLFHPREPVPLCVLVRIRAFSWDPCRKRHIP
jgi:hypothetical protein